jgi:hypothetical protein
VVGLVKKIGKRSVLHYPRLDTVLMVEDTIKASGDYLTKSALWRALPRQVHYQTLGLIVDYLAQSGKIFIGADKKIVWTWDPEGLARLCAQKGLRKY